MNRTNYNGELRISDLGKIVELKGWVSKRRNLGSLLFIDLRDRTGITQIVFKDGTEAYKIADTLKNEYVIYVKGVVIERESKNPNMPTGDIEVEAKEVEIINTSLQPPLIIADKTDALEDTRLKYRYLDLRRPIMQNYLMTKAKIKKSVREYLDSQGFIELDTPILAKSTPEGARDFLVPSRLYEGQFYALPQSPQIFKQLYMIAGFERYYQIARCFRDEDLRADRQLEFDQIDIETSFLNDVEIQTIMEGMFKKLFKDILNYDVPTPFKRLTYDEAVNVYGSDKPDLRFDMKLIDVKELFSSVPFMANSEITKCIVVKNKTYSRKELDEYTRIAKVNNASGLAYLKYQDNALTGSFAKFLDEDTIKKTVETLGLENNDTVLVISGNKAVTNQALGALRKQIGKENNLYDPNEYNFLWVVDFPIFTYNVELGDYEVSTHPFTAPKPECEDLLETDKEHCYANAYDCVLNGYELASGSLRIYNQDLQKRIFKVIGLSDEEVKERFGFFVEALKYGTPPHGGIGFGLDRITMCITKTENIRDVTAFPKTVSGRDLMMESPSTVDPQQLTDVHIKIDE